MLPRFPEFKPLECSDRALVQRLTGDLPSYSDFNFASLWCWDIEAEVRLSQLHDNLIARFSDYQTGETFFSFFGHQHANLTARALLDWLNRTRVRPQIKLVSEELASQLDGETFSVVEERDYADYILDLDQQRKYEGRGFASKRNELRKFLSVHANSSFKILDLQRPDVIDECFSLLKQWKNRKHRSSSYDVTREILAFERCLENHRQLDIIAAGVFVADRLVAVSLLEIISSDTAMCHFEKADTQQFAGISAFLNREIASFLGGRGITKLNIAEDLGVPGLRQNKNSYCPSGLLRKFSVTERTASRAARHPAPLNDVTAAPVIAHNL